MEKPDLKNLINSLSQVSKASRPINQELAELAQQAWLLDEKTRKEKTREHRLNALAKGVRLFEAPVSDIFEAPACGTATDSRAINAPSLGRVILYKTMAHRNDLTLDQDYELYVPYSFEFDSGENTTGIDLNLAPQFYLPRPSRICSTRLDNAVASSNLVTVQFAERVFERLHEDTGLQDLTF